MELILSKINFMYKLKNNFNINDIYSYIIVAMNFHFGLLNI